jgi:hypothetical protein
MSGSVAGSLRDGMESGTGLLVVVNILTVQIKHKHRAVAGRVYLEKRIGRKHYCHRQKKHQKVQPLIIAPFFYK